MKTAWYSRRRHAFLIAILHTVASVACSQSRPSPAEIERIWQSNATVSMSEALELADEAAHEELVRFNAEPDAESRGGPFSLDEYCKCVHKSAYSDRPSLFVMYSLNSKGWKRAFYGEDTGEPRIAYHGHPIHFSVSVYCDNGETFFMAGCVGVPVRVSPSRRLIEATTQPAREATPAKSPSDSISTLDVLHGTIIHKHWTKSGESYRAQGSDYYVLDVGDFALPQDRRTAREGVILRPSVAVPFEHFEEFTGKRVVVCGEFVPNVEYEEYYGDPPDPMEQHPTSHDPVTGKLKIGGRIGGGFRVQEIRAREEHD